MPNPHPSNVWIVDDDPDETFLIQKAVKRRAPDMKLRVFNNPGDVPNALLEAISEQCIPDLILSDLNMPAMDGPQLFAQLERILETFPEVRFILVSGAIPLDIAERTQDLKRLSQILVKPEMPQEFANIIL